MKYFKRTWVALSVATLALAACDSGADKKGDATAPQAAQKVYKWSLNGTPTTFDPAHSATRYSNVIISAVYDTLYEYKYLKEPYELKPALAEAMPEFSNNGLTLTIKLKKGNKFVDDPAFADGKGREVTAQDFVYSLKRHFDPKVKSQGAWLWEGKLKGMEEWKKAGADYSKEVEGVKALDDYTVQINLTQPFPQIVYTLAMGFTGVVPHEAVEKYGQAFGVKPVGSGPFILESHNNAKTVLVKNPNFRKEVFNLKDEGFDPKVHSGYGLEKLEGKTLPIVDRVEANWIVDPEPRWNSFTKGNEITLTSLPQEHMDEVLESKHPIKLRQSFADKYYFNSNTEAGYVFNVFNFQDKNFGHSDDPQINAKNKALRCAIIKSFDWPERINRFYLGMGQAYPGHIVPGTDGFDPNMDKSSITKDVEGAKKLLAENGWNAQNLPVYEYHTTAGVKSKQFYEQMRGFLINIGWPKDKITYKDYATFGDFNKQVRDAKLPVISMGWGLDYPDAENTLQLFYGPNKAPGSNSANYDNPEYNALYEKSSVMEPSAERTEIYKKMNQILVDDCVGISAFSRTGVALWHKNTTVYPRSDFINNYFKYVDVE